MRKTIKYILTFVITVIICILSFILITLIPKDLIKDNMLSSADEMYNLPAFRYFNNYQNGSTLIHNYPDPITFNLTYSLNPRKPVSSMFLTKYYSTNKYIESVNLREKAIHDYDANKEYYRYWHGNIVMVKLLLLVFDYKEILIFLAVVLTVLAVLITYQLFRRDKFLGIIFFISNILVQVYVTFCCLEYIYMFILSYILALISFKFINAKEENIYCLFIVGGVLANFFDFLTTETLVFTLPFLIIYYFRYKDKKVDKSTFIFFIKSALAFLLSYSLMWILKWLILVIFFKQSPSSFLNDHLVERGINENTFKLGFFDSIIINLRQLIPFCFFADIVVIVVSIVYILFLIYNFVRKKFGLYEFILVCISLIPIIRYLVMFMHSYDHYFFTYRALLPSIMIFFIILKIWICNLKRKKVVRKEKYEKISFVVIVLFMFMVWTPVEAKEYNISELYYEIGFNNNQIFEIESGDVIVKGDDRYIFFDLFVYNPSNELIEGYRHPNMPDRYVVKSCQEIIGGEIPRGKKCIINLNAFVGSTSATNAYNHINYLLVDDIQKEIIYNNTYDVENSNPTTYYVEETNILLNDIERDGYRFLGWYSSPTFEEDTRVTMISDAEPEVLELYAKWEKIEEVVDSNEDNIFVNPETNSLIYIGIGIAFILVFANILVIVYKYRK